MTRELTADELEHVKEAFTRFAPTSDFHTEISAIILSKLAAPRPAAGEYAALADKIEKRIATSRAGMGGNVAAVHYHGANDESPLVIEALRAVDRLKQGIRDIAQACVDGIVCDDVAWFTEIPAETLFDKCENLLDEDLPQTPSERAKPWPPEKS